MLLNKVVVGKGYKMTQDNPSLTAPPTGYDSVCILSRFLYLLSTCLGPRGGCEWRIGEF
jgi:hypothetical protein